MHAKAQASNRVAKENGASHGPRVSLHKQTKVRVRPTSENPREIQRNQKFDQRCRSRTKRKSVESVSLSSIRKKDASWNIEKSAQTYATDISGTDGRNGDEQNCDWTFHEWNDDWSSGWNEGLEQTYDTSASSFSLGGFRCQCHQ